MSSPGEPTSIFGTLGTSVPRGTSEDRPNIRERLAKLIGLKAHRYKAVFGTDDGRFVLADLVAYSGADRASYVPGKFDETAYREGMRRVIDRIRHFARMDESEIHRIVQRVRDEQEQAVNKGDFYFTE